MLALFAVSVYQRGKTKASYLSTTSYHRQLPPGPLQLQFFRRFVSLHFLRWARLMRRRGRSYATKTTLQARLTNARWNLQLPKQRPQLHFRHDFHLHGLVPRRRCGDTYIGGAMLIMRSVSLGSTSNLGSSWAQHQWIKPQCR